MKPRSTGPRRASVELRFEPGQAEFPVVAGRALPQFWSLLAPCFRGVFLPPQWRAESNGIAWSWREPAANPPISAAELATLRKRLAGAQRSFAATAADAPTTSDPRSPAATLAPLAACLDELITTLLALPDPAFASYTARTETGLVLHSWGLRSPLTPFYPDTADREISGTVFVVKQAAPNLSVFLETPEGQPISRTTSDANGHFQFLQLTPGHYRVRADSPVTPFPPEGLAIETQRASATRLELHDLAHPQAPAKNPSPRRSQRRLRFVVGAILALVLGGLALRWFGLNAPPSADTIATPLTTSFAPADRAKKSDTEPLPLTSRLVEPPLVQPASARREVAREPAAIAPPSHPTPLPPSALPAHSGQPSPSDPTPAPSSPSSVFRGSLSSTPAAQTGNSAPPSAPSPPPGSAETPSDSSRPARSPAATSPGTPSAQSPNSNPTPPPPASPPPTPLKKSPASDPKPAPTSSTTTPTPKNHSAPPEPRAAPAPEPHRESENLQPEENPPSARSGKRPSTVVASPSSKTASAVSASPPESTAPTQPPSEPVPPDTAESTSTDLAPIDPPPPFTAHRFLHRQLRLAPWRLRLLHDSILPTQPTRVGATPAESPGALRTRLYREHQKKIPAAFLAPVTRRGFALELPLPAPPVAWNLTSPSSSFVASATATRAELSWIDTTPPPPGSRFELMTAAGHVLACVTFDADGEAHLTFSPHLRAWSWLELVSPASPPLLAYLVLSGPEAPDTWKLRATRLDLIAPTAKPGRHQHTVALSDKTTGWSLITDLTESISRP